MSELTPRTKLQRVRRPRVQISYDVNVGGATERVELPFVVGVLADLIGSPAGSLPPLRERRFVEITRDTFDAVLAAHAPRLGLRVADRLGAGTGDLEVELRFRSLADFAPDRIAEQIEPLKPLLARRDNLCHLLGKLPGNDKLDQLLCDVVSNADKARALLKELEMTGEPESPDIRAYPPSSAEQAQGTAATTPSTEVSLLDQILHATRPPDSTERLRHRMYIEEFLKKVVEGQLINKEPEDNIKHWIGEIDKKLSAQLNEVMHHPALQKLEGTWRGLKYLVDHTETGPLLKIKVLNVTKADLLTDHNRAREFNQTELFQKVYEEPYRTPCGTPFGLLVGDYEFSAHREDYALLQGIASVAAASHTPFVAAASPRMFSMQRFTELANARDLSMIFETIKYVPWTSFRGSEDSRYVALTLPRVLARLPYGTESTQVERFDFQEAVDGENHDKYLWMSAAWAYAARVTDAFAQHGWFAATRGVENGGRVEGLPVHTFPTDDGAVAMKCPTEVSINDRREYELSNLGFLPLIHARNHDFAVFLGSQSCHRPRVDDPPEATASAELSSWINLLLCASRFLHYLKVMARDIVTGYYPKVVAPDRIHEFIEVGDMEVWLNRWVAQYVTTNPESTHPDARATKPLSGARIDVREMGQRPGHFEIVAHLRPHFQLETVITSMRLVAEVPRDTAYRPAPIDPGWLRWNGGTVVDLARGIRDGRHFADLPILADALEDAGCADERILGHCRDASVGHQRGCWVLDALLGEG
jgi:type VI secretion system protein ImpC